MSEIILSSIDKVVKEDLKSGIGYKLINHYTGPLPAAPVLVTSMEYIKVTNGIDIDSDEPMYHDIETGRIVSWSELYVEWQLLAKQKQTECETIDMYIASCLNGTLERI